MRLVSALLIGVVLAALSLYVDKQVRPVNLGWFENVNPDWPQLCSEHNPLKWGQNS